MDKYASLVTTKLADVNIGLIGSGIQKSRSPCMHMQEASAQGLKLHYQLIDLDFLGSSEDHLPGILKAIEQAGYAGVNITQPCKQSVIQYLDVLSPDARELGAVNTVCFHSGKRYGYNTDWQGFYLSFMENFMAINKERVLQLGSGGAGSAVAYALGRAGVKTLYLYDLEIDKAKALALRLSSIFRDLSFNVVDEIKSIANYMDGIINTTPVGMKKYPGMPLPAGLVSNRQWIADIIYFPLETKLLKTARSRGCQTMDGSGMAINQAAEAFYLFTGKKADMGRMTQTFYNDFD
jgi:shikimate dehydrogenase